MLSSSSCSSSQGHSALDMDESGSSTMNSSHFTDETTSTSDIGVDIGRKRDDDKVGTEQPYPFPDNPENILELATKILQRFGLEKEDLESLLSYPEDQITVTNLPAILKQICIMKENKTDSSNFPRVTSTTGFDRFSSEGEQIHRVDQNFGFDGVLEETSKRRSSAVVENWGSHDQKSSSTSSSPVKTFVDHPPTNLNNLQTQLQSIPFLFPLVTQETNRISDNSEGSEPKSNWSSMPEMRQIDEMKQFDLIPRDGDPGQAINDNMCKNDSITHGQLINVVGTKNDQKSNQEYQKTQSYSDSNPVRPPSMRPLCPPEAASTQWLLPPPDGAFLPDPTGFSGLPPQAMREDYTAAAPRAFPHTCSLCSTVCINIKDWIIHQNVSIHIEACILFRKTYPNWDCTVPLFESFSDKGPSTSAQTSQCSDHRVWSESRSRSMNPSRMENKCYRTRSSSRSPDPHLSDALMDRSKPEEQEDPNTHRSRSLPSSWCYRSNLRSIRRRSPSGRSEKKKSSSNQRRKRLTRSQQRLRSSRVQQLTTKLMRTSAIQSLTKKPELKTVVRTLVPIILAELRNLKSSSSSSSHSAKRKLDSNFSKVKSDLQIGEPGSSKEPQDDAPKVKRMKSLDIQGSSVTVVNKKEKQLSVEPKVCKKQPTKPASSTDLALHSTRNNASLPKRRRMTTRRVSKTKMLVSKARIIRNCRFVRSLKVGAVKFKVKKQVSKLPESTKLMFTKKKVACKDSKKTQKELKESPKGLEEKTTKKTRRKPKSRVEQLQEDGDVRKEEIKENGDVMQAGKLGTHQTREFEDAETLKHLGIRSAGCVEVKTTTTVKLQRRSSSKTAESYASSCSVFTSEPADLPQTEPDLLKGPTSSVDSSSQSRSKNLISSSCQSADALKTGSSPDFKKRQKKRRKRKKKAEPQSDPCRRTPATTTVPSAAVPTFQEDLVNCLSKKQIGCLSRKTTLSSKLVYLDVSVLLITNLPRYFDGCYREDEIADLLRPFGFIFKSSNIYVIPEKCMAFAQMPSVKTVQDIVVYSDQNHIVFKGSKLSVRVVRNMVSMTPFDFYSFLIKRTHSKLKDNGGGLIFIHNVSHSEAAALRETLIKIGCVTRYLRLLNKVFVEFKNRQEADMLGVWYSLLKRSPAHQVFRMKIPESEGVSPPPTMPDRALPDGSEAVDGAVIPTIKCGVPQGSTPPFWITMTTDPLVFPTFCPWFNIPDHLTVNPMNNFKKKISQASKFCTVMLTGLPEGNYTHQDVAKLVWKHFPKQNLQTLFYNVVVLPLQRRAFVFFSSQNDCSDFVVNHIINPVCVKDSNLSVHLVLEDMQPGFSEETMYRSVMKWSNAHVSQLQHLEERLLCVEISEPTTYLVVTVMKEVAAIAAFVNFLPLANRIVIEMAEPSGVTAAVLHVSLNASPEHQMWSKVKRIEPLKSLNRRLRESRKDVINLESNSSMKPAATSKSTPDKRNLRSEPEENLSPKRRKLEPSDQFQTLNNKTGDEAAQKGRQEGLQVLESSAEDPTKKETKVQKPGRPTEDQPETKKGSIKEPTRTNPPKDEEMVHETQRLSFPQRREAGNVSCQKATEDDEEEETNEEESPANETRKLPKSSLKALRNLDEVKEEDDATEEELREGLWRENLQDGDEEREENSADEFVEPVLGLFCSVCSVFFLDQEAAEESHCCSLSHLHNLKIYYQKLLQH